MRGGVLFLQRRTSFIFEIQNRPESNIENAELGAYVRKDVALLVKTLARSVEASICDAWSGKVDLQAIFPLPRASDRNPSVGLCDSSRFLQGSRRDAACSYNRRYCGKGRRLGSCSDTSSRVSFHPALVLDVMAPDGTALESRDLGRRRIHIFENGSEVSSVYSGDD
jgi:hypothetical protein